MCEELKRELERGSLLAEELVRHLTDMGAANCTIPVKLDGEIYEVVVRNVIAEAAKEGT